MEGGLFYLRNSAWQVLRTLSHFSPFTEGNSLTYCILFITNTLMTNIFIKQSKLIKALKNLLCIQQTSVSGNQPVIDTGTV